MTNPAEAMTRRWISEAGVAEGMRVLDVGSGHGDVAMLAASLVGPRGEVVGIDRNRAAIDRARQRARDGGWEQLRFEVADLEALPPALDGFDAIVVRRVLMYQPDAQATVDTLASRLRPGGVLWFQEADATLPLLSLEPLPLHAKAYGWMWDTVEREGGDRHTGFRLAQRLTDAGLERVQVRAEAIVQTPTQHHPVGMIVRAMLRRIVAQGVATEEEIDVDTLDERLLAERVAAGATFVGDLAFAAWGHRPG